MSTAALIGQWVFGVGGVAMVGAAATYFKDRKMSQANAQVAEGTVRANIRVGNVSALQAHLTYVERIIDNIHKDNVRLSDEHARQQKQIDEAETREQRYLRRIREL